VAFAVEGDGVGFATESYAASALYTTLASLSAALWRIRRASLEEGSAMNSTLKVPVPETRTLIEKIKVDLRKRAEKKAKLMLLKRSKRH
jgi:hypothetical protein